MIEAVATHVVVSSAILALALAVAAWVRPLTARTRYAVLVAGLASLVLPAPAVARLLERNDIVIPVVASGGRLVGGAVGGGLQTAAPLPGELLMAVWLGVAALLLVRWWIVTRRMVATAMRAATPPSPRSVAALRAARERLGLRDSIDLIASPACEAPAVVRVFRPTIILPSAGCDPLDDDELESLLCHECAHVARRDNLLGVFEAFVCSLFWFNPLVWLAHHRIAAAREAACDERVADAALGAETYVAALAKVCRSLLAPRVAAVSCMASTNLEERIEHIMKYDTIKTSAWSHRTMAAASLLTVIFAVGVAGAVVAEPGAAATPDRYRIDHSLTKKENGHITVRLRVVDTVTKALAGESVVTSTTPGGPAMIRFGEQQQGVERDFVINVTTSADGSGSIEMRVTENGVEVQKTVKPFAAPDSAVAARYSGQPITMRLKNAEIKDVLKVLGQLTGMQVVVAEGVVGSVNVDMAGVPWDQALDEIVRDHGLAYRIDGNRIQVYKP